MGRVAPGPDELEGALSGEPRLHITAVPERHLVREGHPVSRLHDIEAVIRIGASPEEIQLAVNKTEAGR